MAPQAMRTHRHRSSQALQTRIAQEAARLIHESGLRDYGEAKRKAALRLGVREDSALPKNSDVEAALRAHLALFAGNDHPRHLRHLREAAVEAMRFFERFQPRLVGAVLDGTADRHSAVCLHLFTERPDEVDHLLTGHGIPYDREERRLRLDPRREIGAPAYLFVAGDAPIDLTVLPLDGLRQAPLGRDGLRPMARATIAQVRELMLALV